MRWIFDLAWLALLVFMASTWPLMPERVGEAHKALPRDQYMVLMMFVALGCPWLATRGAMWLARVFPAGLNLPNKAFWLAPERREPTLAWLREQCFVLGLGAILVLATVHYIALQPGISSWPALPEGLLTAGAGGLVLGVIAWVIRLLRRFGVMPVLEQHTTRSRSRVSRSDELVWREVQPMWALLVLLPVAALVLVSTAGWHGSGLSLENGLTSTVLPVFAVLWLGLGRMVTEVRGDALVWRFGWLGFPRWRLSLDEIVAVEPARSRAREGWGIRFTDEGMLYNAHGLQAVRLTLRSGSRVRVGSSEPQRLIQALQPRLNSAVRH